MYAIDHGTKDTPHLRSSFRRAADTLVRRGKIARRILNLPTSRYDLDQPAGHWRDIYCVMPPGTELSDSHLMGAAYAMVLLR